MPETGALIPVTDEQAKAVQKTAKAVQEAIKALSGVGGFLREIVGTAPADTFALLGGDWLAVRRAENFARILEKAQERLRARNIKLEKPASLSLALPILEAAADESDDELQDLWARLLAAAADPERAKFFRIQFIEAAKKMDPLDAALLPAVHHKGGLRSTQDTTFFATTLRVDEDQIQVSAANLLALGMLDRADLPKSVSAFGRIFLRTITN